MAGFEPRSVPGGVAGGAWLCAQLAADSPLPMRVRGRLPRKVSAVIALQ
jgi:hypothetical protein